MRFIFVPPSVFGIFVLALVLSNAPGVIFFMCLEFIKRFRHVDGWMMDGWWVVEGWVGG